MKVSELVYLLQQLKQDAEVLAIPSFCCGCGPRRDVVVTTETDGTVLIDGGEGPPK